jgi:hypothetical protein
MAGGEGSRIFPVRHGRTAGLAHVALERAPKPLETTVLCGQPLPQPGGLPRVPFGDRPHREDRRGRQGASAIRRQPAEAGHRDVRVLMLPQKVLHLDQPLGRPRSRLPVQVRAELQGVAEALAPDPEAMQRLRGRTGSELPFGFTNLPEAGREQLGSGQDRRRLDGRSFGAGTTPDQRREPLDEPPVSGGVQAHQENAPGLVAVTLQEGGQLAEGGGVLGPCLRPRPCLPELDVQVPDGAEVSPDPLELVAELRPRGG